MNTTHIYNSNDQLTATVRVALRQVHNKDNYLRVITCGKAVVILPDTDRSKDCESAEMLKAMGFVAANGGRNLVAPAPLEERTNVLCMREGETECVYSLTSDQVHLVEELSRMEYLWDEVKFIPIKNFEIRQV